MSFGASLTFDPISVTVNNTATITATGNGTTWLTAPPAFIIVSGGTGASITDQTVIDDVTCTFTLFAGTSVDTLTIQETDNDQTNTIPVLPVMRHVGVTLTLNTAPIKMSVVRDKTAIFNLVLLNADGTPVDLTTGVLRFYASNGDFSISKMSVGGSPAVGVGIVVTNAVGGLATLTIDPADTMALGGQGVFGMPCEFTLVDDIPAESIDLATGDFVVSPNVGTP
jgi:hypothetical protein